jgi:two-component system, NarL family, response regulator DesR
MVMHPMNSTVRLRTLVVDDSAVAQNTLCVLLQRHPTVEIVGRASDGCEALETTKELRPDLVVMDIQMPRMNGLEAAQRIARELPGTSIILVTFHDLPQIREAALQSGAKWFVPKEKIASELAGIVTEVAEAFSVSREASAARPKCQGASG